MPARELKDQMMNEAPPEGGGMQKPPINFKDLALKAVQIPANEELQDILVQIIKGDFDKAKDDRESYTYAVNAKGEKLGFDKWMEELEKLYSGERQAKEVPWKFCSNRSLRIGTAILEMLHSRLFSAVWNEDLTRFRPGEITDTPKVERISKLMDWWIRVWSPLRDFMDNWVKYTAGFGDSLVETAWEVEERDTGDVEEIPVTDEMGQPLTNQDGTSAIQKIKKPKRFERTKSRIISKRSVYFMKGARDVQKDPCIIEEEILYKDLEDMEKQGKALNVTEKLSQYIVITNPSNVSDPKETEKLRRIRMRNVPVKVLRWYGHYDIDGTGFDDSVRLMCSKDHDIYLGGVRMKDVTKSGKRPIEFTKYGSYLNRIDDLFGEGVLDQLKELAEEVDAIFNQLTDGNTLSILKPGFYDPSGDLDAPVIQVAPNKMTPVTDPSRNVYFPPFEINTDRLINALRLVMEFIERLTAASSYIMGRESEIVGGSGTATRTTAIVQAAELRFSRPSERLKTSAARIINQHLDLIQLNIPPGMENRILGEKGEMIFQAGELTDDGISGQFDAYLLNDPTLGSKQTEQQIASMLYSLLMGNLIVGTDPIKIYKVTADLLKSYGKDPIEYLGPEPSMDDIDDPEDENTLMVQGDFARVHPNIAENHLLHIQKHSELMQSPSLQLLQQTAPNLVQQVMQYNQQHIQEHMMMMQTMMSLIQNAGGKGGAIGSAGAGKKPGNPATDPNKGVENTGGPLAQALATQKSGSVQQSA